ncbi:MAG: hypothetical protein AAGC93_27480 [Cyanobacteria bacterium P01_F01_bin.53]
MLIDEVGSLLVYLMCTDKLPGDVKSTLMAVFEDPPPRNIKWANVVMLLEMLGINYKVIDERINILVKSEARRQIFTLHYKSGAGRLDMLDVDSVRHLLLTCGFDPRD